MQHSALAQCPPGCQGSEHVLWVGAGSLQSAGQASDLSGRQA